MHSDIAEEGFYKTKMHRRGPWVGARVWFEDGKMRAHVDGRDVEIEGEAPKGWPWRRITQDDLKFTETVDHLDDQVRRSRCWRSRICPVIPSRSTSPTASPRT